MHGMALLGKYQCLFEKCHHELGGSVSYAAESQITGMKFPCLSDGCKRGTIVFLALATFGLKLMAKELAAHLGTLGLHVLGPSVWDPRVPRTQGAGPTETHLQVPCLLYIFPDEVFLQVLKGPCLGLHPGRAVEGFFEKADEAVRFLGVVVAEVSRAAVGPATGDGIGAVDLPLDGIVVCLPAVGHRQGKATQVIATLTQQVEPICHAPLDQVIFSLLPSDVAKKEGQVVGALCGAVGHACGVPSGSDRAQAGKHLGQDKDGKTSVSNSSCKKYVLNPSEPLPAGDSSFQLRVEGFPLWISHHALSCLFTRFPNAPSA